MVCVIDTHALVWYLTDDKRLGKRAAELLERPDTRIVVPVIVLAELKYLHRRNRISLSFGAVQTIINEDDRCTVYPVTSDLVDLLPLELEIHDALICATASVCKRAFGEDAVVLTKDRAIAELGSVTAVW
jgi:PIN domain nuclease of toxin-antitoxin system